MPRRTTASIAATMGLGLLLSGCGDSVDYPETAPVTGKVTLDGTPVSGANILLRPVEGGESKYPARATSGADGTFTVRTFFSASHDVEGAVPGKYQVAVTKSEPASGAAPASHDAAGVPAPPPVRSGPVIPNSSTAKAHAAGNAAPGSGNVLPSKYANADTSGLEIEVKADQENSLPLELKSR